MRAFLEPMVVVGRGAAALVAAFLPRRRWQAFPGLSIDRLAPVSGAVTLLCGGFFGAIGYLRYAWKVAGGVTDAALHLAAKQAAGTAPGDILAGNLQVLQGPGILSIVAFTFFTPLGLFSLYLLVSGTLRAIAAWLDDPVGDPILTGLDSLMTRSARNVKQTRTRRAREREEGAEVPDRLFAAEPAGVAGFDYLVIASRRKADWTAGTFVITDDKWYTLGEAFEVRLPEGLRTVYPLKEQKVTQVLRRGVAYELPPLEDGRLPAALNAPRKADASRVAPRRTGGRS